MKRLLVTFILLIITHQAGAQHYLRYYEPDDWETLANYRYFTAAASEVGYVYFTTQGGLVIYDEATESWETHWLPHPIYRIGVHSFWLYLEIHPRYAENTWDNYIWFDKMTKEWHYDREPGGENIEWFGGNYDEAQLAQRFPFVNDVDFMDQYLRNFSITCWVTDHLDRYLWIGTNGDGIFKYEIFSGWFEKIRFGLLDDQVQSMQKVGNMIWFGGKGEVNAEFRGLTVYYQDTHEYQYLEARHMPKLPSATINDMVSDGRDMWFATPLGLVRYNFKRHGWQNYDTFSGLSEDDIRTLTMTGDYVWIGTETGLDWLRLDKDGNVDEIGRVDHPKLRYLTIYDLASDKNTVYAATRDGAYKYTPGDTAWTTIVAPAGQMVGDIYSVCVDGEDIYYANYEGLVHYNTRHDEWDWWPFYSTIPAKVNPGDTPRVTQIKADEHNIWVGTDRGVWRYMKAHRDWHQYVSQVTEFDRMPTYVSQSGLVSNDINDIMLDGDYVWFATDLGATRFYWNDPNRTW